MIQNRWDANKAKELRTSLAERVYSSQLLGDEPELVLHGGGNTSLKDTGINLCGEKENLLFVKGSGCDLGSVTENDFSPVRLERLTKLRKLEKLSDPQMVNELKTQLFDANCPTPSVETLLHAFLPHSFVDHTHANAILTLTNQPNGAEKITQLYGPRVGLVSYHMSGLSLAKAAVEKYEENPDVEGLILFRHGIVTFGDTAKQAYDRMIAIVQQAEEYVMSQCKGKTSVPILRSDPQDTASWLTALRGTFRKRGLDCVLENDESDEAMLFVNHPEVEHFSQRGPLTPDHIIRTKRVPMFIHSKEAKAKDFAVIDTQLNRYAEQYNAYFERNHENRSLKKLDPWPRIILIPTVGIVSVGKTKKEACIAKDIYRATSKVILNAEKMDGYEALEEKHLFDIEYWSLEQEKLSLSVSPPALSGKVAIVTGAASGIGLAIAKEYLKQGACVYGLDINESKCEQLNGELNKNLKWGNRAKMLAVDVTQRSDVSNAIRQVVLSSGGIDILVVNAGIFPASKLIEDIPENDWNKSLAVNLNGSFNIVSEMLRWAKNQGCGGDLVFIASKNVPAPGKQAAAYSVAKAGQMQLARVCALEGGSHGIRVNALHPHLIFDTSIWSDEVIEKRSKAYGLTPEQYKKNNLLKTELNSHDVAKAAFALVGGYFSKTTGAQIPVDGGSDRTL